MDIWGYCDECSRWFYCPPSERSWRCPVCWLEPARVVDRSQTAGWRPPGA